MSLENIQKQRFLDTIFKIYYALGTEPNYNDISVLFGQYFNVNRLGEPVPLRYDDLNATETIDYEKLNQIMATLLFNSDVLYDSFHEEVENLYSIISAYNARLNQLKNKRAELEKKIDDHLFAIKNTDGFYYSISNAFNDLSSTDISNTTAYVDLQSRKVSLPKLNSSNFNYIGNILSSTSNADIELYFDGQLKETQKAVDISNVFTGLNNLVWRYSTQAGDYGYKSSKIGRCVLKISIPISSVAADGISCIEGKIISEKAVETSIVVKGTNGVATSKVFSKNSEKDYDVFSFNFSPTPANSVEIYFIKNEPDYIMPETGASKIYVYDFSIDELVISSPYYDTSAIYISNPISVPSAQSSHLTIDAVMIEADEQIPDGCDIKYSIAEDYGSYGQISSYDWRQISPSNRATKSNEDVIYFDGSSFRSKKLIDPTNGSIIPTEKEMIRIPRTTQYKNPIENYFYQNDYNNFDFKLYRMAKFPVNVNPINTYILENVDSKQLKTTIAQGTSLDRDTWKEVLSGQRKDIVTTSYYSNISSAAGSVFFTASNIPYGSVHLSTNVYADSDTSVTKNFIKSLDAQYWGVSVYLNGYLISTVEPGVLTSSISWDFKKGPNSIVLIVNKRSGDSTSFNGSIDLFEKVSLTSFLNFKVYQKYMREVKIEDLRNLYSNDDNVFSIINFENTKEIVYRRTEQIETGSFIYYTENKDNGVNAIRVRADLSRNKSPYSSPSIISYRVKFKNQG